MSKSITSKAFIVSFYTDERELISEVRSRIMAKAEPTGRLFYARLFEIAPHLKPLFKNTSMRNQHAMFIYMIGMGASTFMNNAQDYSLLQTLGVRHRSYGIKIEHFGYFREALLWAFTEVMGDDFTPDHAAAWNKLFTAIVHTMNGDVAASQ